MNREPELTKTEIVVTRVTYLILMTIVLSWLAFVGWAGYQGLLWLAHATR